MLDIHILETLWRKRKAKKRKIKEAFDDDNEDDSDDDSDEGEYEEKSSVVGIVLKITFTMVMVYLALTCNKDEQMIKKVVIGLFAFFFSLTYFIYFMLFHVIMDGGCKQILLNLLPI